MPDKFEFTDTEGRNWLVPEIKLSHVMMLNKIGIELNDVISEGHLWTSEDQSMLTTGALLWQLCKGQHAGVEEEPFFHAFDGEVFSTAQEALALRVANFTPPRRRAAIKKMLQSMKKLESKVETMIDEELDEAMDEKIEDLLNNVSSELGKRESKTPETVRFGS